MGGLKSLNHGVLVLSKHFLAEVTPKEPAYTSTTCTLLSYVIYTAVLSNFRTAAEL